MGYDSWNSLGNYTDIFSYLTSQRCAHWIYGFSDRLLHSGACSDEHINLYICCVGDTLLTCIGESHELYLVGGRSEIRVRRRAGWDSLPHNVATRTLVYI